MRNFQTVDEMLVDAAEMCLNFGHVANPRALRTKEIIHYSAVLSNPRNRLVGFPERHWSLPLAIGEFCWHMRGDIDLDTLAYYAPRWRDFSDDGRVVAGSCYGAKAFSRHGAESAWGICVDILESDPESRRAIITFDEMVFSDATTLDKSCLTSMQFFVRDDRLHLISNMRSNDIYLGLPYDVFLFTMMQEVMANTIGVDLGKYIHVVGSLHAYENDIRRFDKAYSTHQPKPEMGVMPRNIDQFLIAEEKIRTGVFVDIEKFDPYWVKLLEVLKKFRYKMTSEK